MKYEKYYKGRNDLFSGIVLSAFSIAYLIGATRIKIPKMLSSSFLNASSVPKLWGTLLLILGIILVIRGVRVMKAEKAAGNAPEKKTAAQMVKDFWSANRAVIEMFVVLLIYIALIQPVGFLISTFLFLFAEFNILSYKEDRKIGFHLEGIQEPDRQLLYRGIYRHRHWHPARYRRRYSRHHVLYHDQEPFQDP